MRHRSRFTVAIAAVLLVGLAVAACGPSSPAEKIAETRALYSARLNGFVVEEEPLFEEPVADAATPEEEPVAEAAKLVLAGASQHAHRCLQYLLEIVNIPTLAYRHEHLLCRPQRADVSGAHLFQ